MPQFSGPAAIRDKRNYWPPGTRPVLCLFLPLPVCVRNKEITPGGIILSYLSGSFESTRAKGSGGERSRGGRKRCSWKIGAGAVGWNRNCRDRRPSTSRASGDVRTKSRPPNTWRGPARRTDERRALLGPKPETISNSDLSGVARSCCCKSTTGSRDPKKVAT